MGAWGLAGPLVVVPQGGAVRPLAGVAAALAACCRAVRLAAPGMVPAGLAARCTGRDRPASCRMAAAALVVALRVSFAFE